MANDGGQFASQLREERNRYAGLQTHGQLASALRRQRQRAAEEANPTRRPRQCDAASINWDNENEWQEGTVCIPISQIDDESVWRVIEWMARSCFAIYHYVTKAPPSTDIKPAKAWMQTRPLFIRLVRDAVKRDLGFPHDVFQFLQETVERHLSLQTYQPWRDPDDAWQPEALKGILLEAEPPLPDYGRPLRSLEL